MLGSYGSWDTWLTGAQFNTGDLQQWGDARAVVGYDHVSSDGYLENSAQRRDNFYSFVADKLSGVRLMTLAEMLEQTGDPRDALNSYQKVLTQEPEMLP